MKKVFLICALLMGVSVANGQEAAKKMLLESAVYKALGPTAIYGAIPKVRFKAKVEVEAYSDYTEADANNLLDILASRKIWENIGVTSREQRVSMGIPEFGAYTISYGDTDYSVIILPLLGDGAIRAIVSASSPVVSESRSTEKGNLLRLQESRILGTVIFQDLSTSMP